MFSQHILFCSTMIQIFLKLTISPDIPNMNKHPGIEQGGSCDNSNLSVTKYGLYHIKLQEACYTLCNLRHNQITLFVIIWILDLSRVCERKSCEESAIFLLKDTTHFHLLLCEKFQNFMTKMKRSPLKQQQQNSRTSLQPH